MCSNVSTNTSVMLPDLDVGGIDRNVVGSY